MQSLPSMRPQKTSLWGMMATQDGAEVFAAEARRHWIDPSAWMSGLSFGLGCLICGWDRLSVEILERGPGLYLIPACYAAFLIAVLLMQRQMQKSMLASSFGMPHHLVTSGPFRYSRNPIYVAFFLPIASLASVSVLASMVAALVYVVTMNRFVIIREERELQAIFGEEFRRYAERTPRWLVY
jgi:protein-S-isoprenylcysteine O-methyltransferase Ste14